MMIDSPLWARLYDVLGQSPAVAQALGLQSEAQVAAARQELLSYGLSAGPFPWRVANGAVLAISPHEGNVAHATVGWTCFTQGAWEPHIEVHLRRMLRPGDVAVDVGANMGYFTAVMAQCVTPSGHVDAFEPAAATFQRLEACVAWNSFSQVTPVRCALGAAAGRGQLFFHETATANASLHQDPLARLARPEDVEIRALDELVACGRIAAAPRLIKLDIEGHERDALLGARATLRAALPVLVLEYNERTSRIAGWNAGDLEDILAGCAYRFFQIDDRSLQPVRLRELVLRRNTSVDLVAISRNSRPLPIDLPAE